MYIWFENRTTLKIIKFLADIMFRKSVQAIQEMNCRRTMQLLRNLLWHLTGAGVMADIAHHGAPLSEHCFSRGLTAYKKTLSHLKRLFGIVEHTQLVIISKAKAVKLERWTHYPQKWGFLPGRIYSLIVNRRLCQCPLAANSHWSVSPEVKGRISSLRLDQLIDWMCLSPNFCLAAFLQTEEISVKLGNISHLNSLK